MTHRVADVYDPFASFVDDTAVRPLPTLILSILRVSFVFVTVKCSSYPVGGASSSFKPSTSVRVPISLFNIRSVLSFLSFASGRFKRSSVLPAIVVSMASSASIPMRRFVAAIRMIPGFLNFSMCR